MKVLILACEEKKGISGRHMRWIGPLKTVSGIKTKLVTKSKSYVSFIFRVLWTTYHFRPDVIISMGADLIGFISILISKFMLGQSIVLSLGGDPISVRQVELASNKRQLLKYKIFHYLNLYVYKNCRYFMVNSYYLKHKLRD